PMDRFAAEHARLLPPLGGLRGFRALRLRLRRGALRDIRCFRARAVGLQPGGALDDPREHLARFAFGRPIRLPDRGRLLAEDVLEVAVALYAARRKLGDVDLARPVVAMLDEQPGPVRIAAACARIASASSHEHPRSLELVAVQRELEVAF